MTAKQMPVGWLPPGICFTIHNVQPQTPIANLVAMYEAVREYGAYPLR